jgi:uncharacterized glyoxalase superfamily protein PhnB
MVVNRSAPSATVVPVLIYEDVAKAIDWLCGAFGFKERLRAAGRDGRISHAQLSIAECALMLGARGGQFQPPRTGEVNQFVIVHVDDVDGHLEQAKRFGVRILQPLADQRFGERQYSVEDHEGHRWTFSQHFKDVAPEEWGAAQARTQVKS